MLNWFNNITEKEKHSFITMDVVEFYPSISDTLLNAALDFAAKYTNISAEDRNIIIKAKSSILFNEGNPWGKKSS